MPDRSADRTRDRVVLLHGIAAGSRSMRRLEVALRSAEYATLNLSYPSRRSGLADLVARIDAQRPWIEDHDGDVHFVTYSMGGLLARAYLSRHRPPGLGRVVMLAPPNGGSEVADLLVKSALFTRIFGPAGAELTTRPPADVRHLLGTVDYTLGIIAGDRFLDPVGWALISRPNDGRVSVERTKVAGMTDHVTVPASHFGLRRNTAAIRQTIHFLRYGRFIRSSSAG